MSGRTDIGWLKADWLTPGQVRFTGVIYLLIAIVAGAIYALVSQGLFVAGDAAQTAANVEAKLTLLRWGIVGYIVTLILDVLMSGLMYRLLAPVSRALAALSSLLRLTYVFVHGAAVLSLLNVLALAEGSMTAFGPEMRADMMLHYGEAHIDGFMMSLVFFGLHLMLAGYLIFKSGYLPKLIGIFLIPAGLAYVLDTVLMLILPDYLSIKPMFEPVVIVVAILGEVGLLLWLLIKGIKEPVRLT